MQLKKRLNVAIISCAIGLCSVGQRVYAKDLVAFKGENQMLEGLVQKKIKKEQDLYVTNKKTIKKLNIQKKIVNRQHIEGLNRELTKKERKILERIVEAEATGKDIKSKILVANVIINRLKSKEFPNTIEEVVFQRENGKVQFSPTADGRYWEVEVTKHTKESVAQAIEGVDYSEGALYFVEKTMASPKNVSWFERSLTRLFTYEGHSFYR